MKERGEQGISTKSLTDWLTYSSSDWLNIESTYKVVYCGAVLQKIRMALKAWTMANKKELKSDKGENRSCIFHAYRIELK